MDFIYIHNKYKLDCIFCAAVDAAYMNMNMDIHEWTCPNAHESQISVELYVCGIQER